MLRGNSPDLFRQGFSLEEFTDLLVARFSRNFPTYTGASRGIILFVARPEEALDLLVRFINLTLCLRRAFSREPDLLGRV
jgi:hypothetical protein